MPKVRMQTASLKMKNAFCLGFMSRYGVPVDCCGFDSMCCSYSPGAGTVRGGTCGRLALKHASACFVDQLHVATRGEVGRRVALGVGDPPPFRRPSCKGISFSTALRCRRYSGRCRLRADSDRHSSSWSCCLCGP